MFNQFHNDAMGKLLLRLTVAGLMLFHGIAKVLNPGSLNFIGNQLSSIGMPAALSYGVYIGEIIAPLMILIGYRSRIGGLIIAANMIVAIVLAHSGDIFSLSKHGGYGLELQAFYLLGGLTIALLGSGKYAMKPD
jgi:putative oxidoreductase